MHVPEAICGRHGSQKSKVVKVKTIIGGLAAAGIVVAALAGYSQSGTALFRPHPTPLRAPVAQVRPAAPAASATAGLPDFTSIAERNSPAVVNITVAQVVNPDVSRPMQRAPQLDPEDPFYEFYKHFQIPPPTPMPRGATPARALGSGFIVSPDGLILTNAHVVAGANEVTVRLTDKREFKAKIVGIDRATDVAALKIDARELPTVSIGNPDDVRPGQWVLAIGSPFGMDSTVTAGIVSAKFRALPDENYVSFIQTDVAVNPGSSGGPLLDLKGDVIGMNSQIYSNTGGYEGLSFAIPIDVAMKVKDQLVKYGKVERGRIGVTIQPLNQDLANSFGLAKADGALVSAVEKGSPAEKAGLKPGDVILKFNGQAITDAMLLSVKVAQLRPGMSATLEIWRDGSAKDVSVTLGSLKDTALNS